MKTVALVERRTAVRRVPRADVDELLGSFRHVVEVTPTTDSGTYRLTALGYAGVFRTRNRLWHVRPKLGWDAVRLLFDPSTDGSLLPHRWSDLPGELGSLLAARLAVLMDAVSAGGLVRGYTEAEVESRTVRGRIDLPRTVRGEAAGSGRMYLRVDEFTPDVPWNQLPVAAGRRLLALPGLAPGARAGLAAALVPFADVSEPAGPLPPVGTWPFDRRTERYRPLIEWSALVLASVGGDLTLLVNLEHLFESHVADLLVRGERGGWSVRPQQLLRLTLSGVEGGVELIPDLIVHGRDGSPAAVWDTKWKLLSPAGPDPADVQQVLAYAATLGVSRAGLIYPGRRFTARTYHAPSAVRVAVLTHRLAGDPDRLRAARDRLARAVFGFSGGAGRT